MNKRKILSYALLVVLVVATGGFLYFRATEKPIEVKGQLSPEDLAAIKSVVHHRIWQGTFSNLSFKSLGYLPSVIKKNLSLHIDSIEESAGTFVSPQTASVRMTFRKSEFGGVYICTKSSNQWICVKIVLGDQYVTRARTK